MIHADNEGRIARITVKIPDEIANQYESLDEIYRTIAEDFVIGIQGGAVVDWELSIYKIQKRRFIFCEFRGFVVSLPPRTEEETNSPIFPARWPLFRLA